MKESDGKKILATIGIVIVIISSIITVVTAFNNQAAKIESNTQKIIDNSDGVKILMVEVISIRESQIRSEENIKNIADDITEIKQDIKG